MTFFLLATTFLAGVLASQAARHSGKLLAQYQRRREFARILAEAKARTPTPEEITEAQIASALRLKEAHENAAASMHWLLTAAHDSDPEAVVRHFRRLRTAREIMERIR